MVNLLPEPARERAAIEYRFRLGTVANTASALCIIGASVLLLPAYFFADLARTNAAVQEKSIQQALSSASLTQAAKEERVSAALLGSLSSNLLKPRPTIRIEQVLAARPAGIVVRHISYSGKSASTVKIAGTASNRDALLSFRDALTRSEGISDVNLPITDLAKPSAISFQLTITFSS